MTQRVGKDKVEVETKQHPALSAQVLSQRASANTHLSSSTPYSVLPVVWVSCLGRQSVIAVGHYVTLFRWDKLQNKMARPSTVANTLCRDDEQHSDLTAYPDSSVCRPYKQR